MLSIHTEKSYLTAFPVTSGLASPVVYYLPSDYTCLPIPTLLHFSGLRHTPAFSNRPWHTPTQCLLPTVSPSELGQEEQQANESRHNPLPLILQNLHNWYPGRWLILATHLLHAGFSLGWFFPQRWRSYIPLKCQFTYALYGTISQMTVTYMNDETIWHQSEMF
jgi:hypothetical protein